MEHKPNDDTELASFELSFSGFCALPRVRWNGILTELRMRRQSIRTIVSRAESLAGDTVQFVHDELRADEALIASVDALPKPTKDQAVTE